MEAEVLSDESNGEEKYMRDQLSEFGLDEENLSKEEMRDLLKALNNSKSTAEEDNLLRTPKVSEVEPPSLTPKSLKRRYKDVQDRRLPWSLFSRELTNAEKARVLSVYIKLMAINRYRQARECTKYASWAPPLQILERTNKVCLRSTRSGRNVPIYCSDIDEDSSDLDFAITKPKRRKISASDQSDGNYTNKVISLKRKGSKDEGKPAKEKEEASTSFSLKKTKKECITNED